MALLATADPAVADPITRIWLTHQTSDPSAIVVNWETDAPGPSRVEFGPSESLGSVAEYAESASLHHVEIPFPQEGTHYYRVATGDLQSAIHPVKAYAGDALRVAAAANWYLRPGLDALRADDPHLLLACGDLVPHVIAPDEAGDTGYTAPFSSLIEGYPELFARIPFLPAPGNHDRQIRLRDDTSGNPIYDVEATAFRRFFPLPEDGRRYFFDVPAFGVRFIALDLSHIPDMGTRFQSCQAIDRASPQFRWYRNLMRGRSQRFVVPYYNEQHNAVRHIDRGAWETLLRQGSAALSGFGSFAERAEAKGLPYFNTALKTGDDLRDPQASKFYAATANYVLMTFPKEGDTMTVELKGLDGAVLDRSAWPGRPKPGNRR